MENLVIHGTGIKSFMIGLLFVAFAVPTLAQCDLSVEEQRTLDMIVQGSDPARGILLGMALYDAHKPPMRNCINEARAAFLRARKEMLALSDPSKTHRDLLNAVDGFFLLGNAYDELGRNNLTAARQILVEALVFANGWLRKRVVMFLGDLIRDKPHAGEWAKLLPVLKGVAHFDWRARGLYTDHLLSLGKADLLAEEVILDLNGDLEEQKRLELITLLAYVRYHQEALDEAVFLLGSIEEDMGLHMLDPGFRLNYLNVCIQVWHARYKHDGDPLTFQMLDRILRLKKQMEKGGRN